MGSWYWIGVSVGLGVAVGVLWGGQLGLLRSLAIGAFMALVGGFFMGWLIKAEFAGGWADPAAGLAGGVLAFFGAAQIVLGALRRGGTREGTAVLVAGAALLAAGVAFIPVAGYLEALVLPALAVRLRRTQPERYAGLRTLARD